MSQAPAHPIDYVRKALIVLALIGGMLVLHQFAVPVAGGVDPGGLLALGFVVLAAYTVGELVGVLRIPHITGYLLAGVLFGPSVAEWLLHHAPIVRSLPPLSGGILSAGPGGTIEQLGSVDALALAVIALSAGGSMKLADLRRDLKHVIGATVAMTVAVISAVTLYVGSVTTFSPATFPTLSGLPADARWAVALVLGSLAAATSPAVTIAVINSTGARGPVTSTILAGVVVGEALLVLLFSLTTTVAIGTLDASGSVSVVEALSQVGGSISLGAAVGILIAGYLRFVRADLLLFLVAVIFTTTFAVRQIHGEAALAFISAGLVVGNLSNLGERLIRELERLSGPVYVVFFALAGAKLHLDEVAALFLPAMGLFTVRFIAVYGGTTWGARLTDAPEAVRKYAWTGFVPQAGLAIALATQARGVLPEFVGSPLFSIAMSSIAIAELMGAIVFQSGLRAAREIGESEPLDASDVTASGPTGSREPSPVERYRPRHSTGDPGWGPRVDVGSARLDEALHAVETLLHGLLREHVGGAFRAFQSDGVHSMRQLRRATLRVLRRAANHRGNGDEIAERLRSDAAELASHWRGIIAESPRRTDAWSPMPLQYALDSLVSSMPTAIEARVPPAVLDPRPEPSWAAARRALLRVRQRILPTRRSVNVHLLGRYHFSGLTPARLEALAAVALRHEVHVADRIGALFESVARGLEAVARQAESGHPDRVSNELTALRSSVDREFGVATLELHAMADDGVALATRVVAEGFAAIRADAARIGTMDLATSQRRFNQVFRARNRDVASLTGRLRQATILIRSRREQLALELELVGIGARVRSAVRSRGAGLARQLRARGSGPLALVVAALHHFLDEAGRAIGTGVDAAAASRALRREIEPVLVRIREASTEVAALVAEVSDEHWVASLVQSLDAHAQELSETYTVPTASPAIDGRLPGAVAVSTIAFRELVIAFVDARVARELVDLTSALTAQAQRMAAAVEEVDRACTFNVELACHELDLVEEGSPVPAETAEVVSGMVAGPLGRIHQNLVRVVEGAEQAADRTEQQVHDSVLDQFEALRRLVLEGRVGERAAWLRDGRLLGLARRAEQWRGWAPRVTRSLEEGALQALGEDRLDAVRATLGLKPVARHEDREVFAPPAPRVDVPVVYRRLFSELPLEVGELLGGRDADLRRLQLALTAPGPLRTAAVVAVDAASASALVTSVARNLFDGVVRLEPRAPLEGAAVDEWLHRAERVTDQIVVVDSLHWWFERRPGGLAPLRRLAEAMSRDNGRNAWVIVGEGPVWSFVREASPLGESVGAVVELKPLTAPQLERAVLSRHGMTGHGVRFDDDGALPEWLLRVLSGGADPDQRRQAWWFRELHRASGGVLSDALGLWMGSIRAVDPAREWIELGPVPQPPLARLSQLPDEWLFTLLETARQGWTTAEHHERLFRTTHAAADAHLGTLGQRGLLTRHDAVWRLAGHLRGPLYRVFAQRGWL